MSFVYPFEVRFWKFYLRIKNLKIPCLKVVTWQDKKLCPIYWATDFYNLESVDSNDYYYYDYSEDNYWEDDDEDYYCYDEYDNYEDDDFDSPGLMSSLYDNELLICSFVQRENGYTALASQHVLIADIDCQDNVNEPLHLLRQYTEKTDSCFAVYKTLNGMRYIQLDCIYQNVNRSAIETLNFLGSDPKYVDFCRKDGRFMARVTPKSDTEEMKQYLSDIVRGKADIVKICNFVFYVGNISKISSFTELFIKKHDYLTNTNALELPLA